MISMPPRPYKEVPVRAIGAQHNQSRFQGQWDRSYLISRWRGNLTALSQKHNLYFVCCRHTIQVYQPAFPDQTLPLVPSVTITPPVSSPNLEGYIDEAVPHSINRILVDFLGNQEVLLIACDDGDVIGFYTDTLYRTVVRRTNRISKEGLNVDDIRPFFHENLGMSAWGLAVHQESRKLAVSCNTQQVTVFAFALVTQHDGDVDEAHDNEIDMNAQSPEDRAGDQVIQLPAADHNIPHVSFCNTGDDREGKFLLATDIIGNLIMYDIDQRRIVRSIRCAYCKTGAAANHKCLCRERSSLPHALWGALWLDRRSFSRQQDVRAATGLADLSSSHLSRSWALDISRSRHDVPNSSLEYMPRQNAPDQSVVLNEDGEDYLDNSDEEVSIEEEEADGVYGSDEGPTSNPSPNAHSPILPDQASQGGSSSPGGGEGVPLPSGESNLTLMQQLEVATTNSGALWSGVLHPAAQAAGIQAITRQPKRLHYITKPTRKEQWPYFVSPACPSIQLSINDITRFQPRDHDHNLAHEEGRNPHGGALPPAIFLHDPLWQRIPATRDNPFYNSDHLSTMARFSLVAQIPTIGVVLAGSPFGRVAVLSLAQTQVALPTASSSKNASSRSSSSSSSSPSKQAGRRRAALKNFYSMRLDHILPFESQEKAGDRPERLLLGLAVSPVQGMLGRREADVVRWRVLLMYEDQSLLSYEISRPRTGDGPVRAEMLGV